MSCFRLTLALHMPIIMPRVPIRLDALVNEAMCRITGDWSRAHALPLAQDEVVGFHASQIVLAQTLDKPLSVMTLDMPDATKYLDRANVTDPPIPFKEDGGKRPKRLTHYEAILTPFAVFYGEGDGRACADLVTALDGMGREHMRGAGAFDVVEVADDDTDGWRLRAHRRDACDARELPFDPVADAYALVPGGHDVPVWRPEHMLREILR